MCNERTGTSPGSAQRNPGFGLIPIIIAKPETPHLFRLQLTAIYIAPRRVLRLLHLSTINLQFVSSGISCLISIHSGFLAVKFNEYEVKPLKV